ncbi:unnamed protein product [Triticum turgidum subsp. durum]|uniref:Uncharacterized protein n=1 Tax=Triticum turgidum subsp. durum TaxID=4567 RepID=A0A9R1R0R1_TRITD|nr:unnamed protein product [Triticum turgidum subsp. durum]
MPSSDKQLAFSVKTAASRELLNKGTNIINMSQGTSLPPKDKGAAEEPLKAVGTKRLHTDAPSSPVYHNVYVRRKVETEHNKVNSSPEMKVIGKDKTKQQEEQRNVETEHSKVSCSQELKGSGSEITKEQGIQRMETEHSKVNPSQELKGSGSEKTKEQEERKVKTEHSKVNPSQELKGSGSEKTKGQEIQKMETEHSRVNPSQELKGSGSEKTEEHEEQKVKTEHSKVSSSKELKGNGGEKIEEQEDQQMVQCDQVSKPEVAPPIAESGIKEQDEQQMVQVNKPEVAPPISESGIKEQDEQKTVQEQEELQMVQHDQVNKPEVAPPVAEPMITEQEEPQMVQHDQVNKPEVAPTIAESAGLVSSEMTESGGLEPSKSPEETHAETVPKINELPIASANEPPIAPSTTVQGDIRRSGNQNPYWSERYDRLQTYLENCDRSPQEGYMRMLRSLSAAGRSMHAIELEKRAIHLLVEEGKELQRMKALNVLGKVSPNGPSKQDPLQRSCQK